METLYTCSSISIIGIVTVMIINAFVVILSFPFGTSLERFLNPQVFNNEHMAVGNIWRSFFFAIQLALLLLFGCMAEGLRGWGSGYGCLAGGWLSGCGVVVMVCGNDLAECREDFCLPRGQELYEFLTSSCHLKVSCSSYIYIACNLNNFQDI